MRPESGRKERALAAAAGIAPPAAAAPIEFHSEGRVLVIGSGAEAVDAAAVLSADLDCHALVEHALAPPSGVRVHRHAGERVLVHGHLGRFRVLLEREGSSLDLGAEVDAERPMFDLILDLGEAPALTREWGPLGYFRPIGEAALALALSELRATKGRSEKPKFFHLDNAACAHGLPGTAGCRRCIDACPAEAVSSEAGRIAVDAHLCQGGGSCSTVCPTGAITSLTSPREHALQALRTLLAIALEDEASAPPVIVLFAEDDEPETLASWPDDVLPWPLPELGAAGLELLLAALALGAGALRLVRDDALPPRVASALDEQLAVGRSLLVALGLPAAGLSWMDPGDDPRPCERLPRRPAIAGQFPAAKPAVVELALAHLAGPSTAAAGCTPLPAGAALGAVHVDGAACTTCLSCAHLCPTHALRGEGAESPRLLFTESSCVQCGLCRSACPEDAIELEPRLLLPRDAAAQPRVLHEDEAFACVRCGSPFAPASTVNAIVAQLRDHPMFAGEALEVLKCCDDCRLQSL